jgi:hypothetical protein
MNLIDFIVCDDVRQELGGKPSLMGVYNNLVLNLPPGTESLTWPFPLKLAFVVRCQIEAGEVKPDSFRVEFIQNGMTFTHVEGSALITENVTMFSLFVVHNAFPIAGLGPIHFRVIFRRGAELIQELEPLYFLNVELGPQVVEQT